MTLAAEDILTISAAVVLLTQLVKWAGVRDKHSVLAVMVTSFLGVSLWVISVSHGFDHRNLFSYFAGWVAVAASAAGVWGFIRETHETLTTIKKNGPPQ